MQYKQIMYDVFKLGETKKETQKTLTSATNNNNKRNVVSSVSTKESEKNSFGCRK